MGHDPQHGMTYEFISINIYGMSHKWVLLDGYVICAHLNIILSTASVTM
jgi:hypothetical protein